MPRPILVILAALASAAAAVLLWLSPPVGRAVNQFLWRSEAGNYTGIMFYPNHVGVLESTRTSPGRLDNRDPQPASHRFIHQHFVTDAFVTTPPQSFWNRLGCYDWRGQQFVFDNDEQISDRKLLIPACLPIAGLLLPGGIWLGLLQRDRVRRDRRCCMHCGYDLRASPGPCPECGLLPRI